jgi:F420-0:gamma-glutamyl ligase
MGIKLMAMVYYFVSIADGNVVSIADGNVVSIADGNVISIADGRWFSVSYDLLPMSI